MKRFLVVLFLAVCPAVCAADPASTEEQVQSVFAELRMLKPMQAGKRYTLPARGTELSGAGDDFLRRRTAAEISESGLHCGCGDFALLFVDRMEARGFETLLVDSAEISSRSLANGFAGHSVVAIRERAKDRALWWLVDSTARNVLSRDWSPQEKSFSAGGYVYWIGYGGPRERYPARSPAELKRFYVDTLATVAWCSLAETTTRRAI